MQVVAVDIAGPFPREAGNLYILVAGNYFWSGQRPIWSQIKENGSETNKFFCWFSTPEQLHVHSDQGKQFKNQICSSQRRGQQLTTPSAMGWWNDSTKHCWVCWLPLLLITPLIRKKPYRRLYGVQFKSVHYNWLHAIFSSCMVMKHDCLSTLFTVYLQWNNRMM